MKRKIHLLVVLGLIFFSSCSKKDPEPVSNPEPDAHLIIGQWKAIYQKHGTLSYPQMNPVFPNNFIENYPYRNEIVFDFKQNQVFTEMIADTIFPSGFFFSTYNYSLGSNKVIFNTSGNGCCNFFQSGPVYIDSLTNNRLVLRDTTFDSFTPCYKVRIITAIRK